MILGLYLIVVSTSESDCVWQIIAKSRAISEYILLFHSAYVLNFYKYLCVGTPVPHTEYCST